MKNLVINLMIGTCLISTGAEAMRARVNDTLSMRLPQQRTQRIRIATREDRAREEALLLQEMGQEEYNFDRFKRACVRSLNRYGRYYVMQHSKYILDCVVTRCLATFDKMPEGKELDRYMEFAETILGKEMVVLLAKTLDEKKNESKKIEKESKEHALPQPSNPGDSKDDG